MTDYVYLNNQCIPAADAVVPVSDRGLAYGDAIFETLKITDGRPVFFEEHYQRLSNGMEAAGIEADLRPGDLKAQAESLARENGVSEGRLRIFVSRGIPPGLAALDPAGDMTPTLLLTAEPFPGHPQDIYDEGVDCITVRANRGRYAFIKSASLMTTILARREARQAGVFEAVFTGGHGELFEGTVSNIFFHDGEKLMTAPRDNPLLPGVTRQKVLDIAVEMDMEVKYKAIKMDEIDMQSTSAFLTGSLLGVCPIRQIDNIEIKLDAGLIGALSSRLGELELASIS